MLLIRDPREVVASYIRSRDEVTADDIGLPQQVRLYDEWVALGQTPRVIDSADFLQDPEAFLRGLCDLVGIGFTDAMLSWPAGRRDTDGAWGRTGTTRSGPRPASRRTEPREVDLHGQPAAVAEQTQPLYERLHALRWTP